MYSQLADGCSNLTIHKDFDLLCRAKVLHKVPAVKIVGLPLGVAINSKKFKSPLVEIRLMQRLSNLPVYIEIWHENLLAIYRGKLSEQFVDQELLI
ncbi:hypothetical protein QP938_04755 [Porticoccaceae bacterium LTM1]|nr:hypothetical protein QP938_04755 [Porticoccaceae bacterium LTM1]